MNRVQVATLKKAIKVALSAVVSTCPTLDVIDFDQDKAAAEVWDHLHAAQLSLEAVVRKIENSIGGRNDRPTGSRGGAW
jgi:hypothetical protein